MHDFGCPVFRGWPRAFTVSQCMQMQMLRVLQCAPSAVYFAPTVVDAEAEGKGSFALSVRTFARARSFLSSYRARVRSHAPMHGVFVSTDMLTQKAPRAHGRITLVHARDCREKQP